MHSGAELQTRGEPIKVNDTTKFVGMDVSKEKIAIAVADSGREPARYWGEIPHRVEAIRKLLKQLGMPRNCGCVTKQAPRGMSCRGCWPRWE